MVRMLVGKDNIKIGVSNAFQRILTVEGDWRPNIYGLVFDFLQPSAAEAL